MDPIIQSTAYFLKTLIWEKLFIKPTYRCGCKMKITTVVHVSFQTYLVSIFSSSDFDLISGDSLLPLTYKPTQKFILFPPSSDLDLISRDLPGC